MILSAGNRNDILFAEKLIEGLNVATVLADKGYNAKKFRSSIQNPVIPYRKDKLQNTGYDKELYKKRNVVERFFLKIKQFRRIGTRYDKTIISFMGMIQVGVFIIMSRLV